MNLQKLSFLSILISLNLYASTSGPKVVYGIDNRQDTFEVTSVLYRKLAESTAAMVHADRITIRGTTAELNGTPLSEFIPFETSTNVCQHEKFSFQPTIAECSGFLVTDNVIATAGHCMTSIQSCQNFRWVFNYKVSASEQSAVSVDRDDVYSCSRIIKQGLTHDTDFALIELDRPAKRKPVKIAKTDPAISVPLVMIGHPSGLPQKVTDGAKVASLLPNGFKTDLDAFRGNSGSAVFRADTGELVGILVNGQQDYRQSEKLNCSEVNVVSQKEAGEGVSSFRQFVSFME